MNLKKIFKSLKKDKKQDKISYVVFDENTDKILSKLGKLAREHLEAVPPSKRKKILYFLSYHHSKFMALVDAITILSLQLRGAEVYVIRQAYFYDKEDVIFGGVYNENRYNLQYNLYSDEGILLNKLLQVKTIELGAFLNQEDYSFVETFAKNVSVENWENIYYEDFPIGEYAYYATVNMNNIPAMNSDEKLIAQYKIHVKNCILVTIASKRLLETLQADSYVSGFPLYYQWKIPCLLIKRMGKRYFSPFLCERKNSVLWSDNTYFINDFSKAWNSFKKSSEYDKYKHVLEDILKERSSGKCSVHNLIPDAGVKNDKLNAVINKISKAPTLLFPANILVDGAVLRKTSAYDNIEEMIIDIIEWFGKHPKYNLVLKAHPAERIYIKCGTDISNIFLRTFLDNHNIKLPENVIFIDNDADISVYSLFPYIKGIIAYTSSTCVDAGLYGLPSVSADASAYTVTSFSNVPKTVNECYDLVMKMLDDNIGMQKQEIMLEARKYYLLFRLFAQIDFKLFEGAEVLIQPHLLFDSIDAIMPGNNEALDYICDSIINGKEIFGDNRWPPITL